MKTLVALLCGLTIVTSALAQTPIRECPSDMKPLQPLLSAPPLSYVKISGVGFMSQLSSGCSGASNNCCGIASILMATAYQYRVSPSTAYFAKAQKLLGTNACCGPGTTACKEEKVARASTVGNCPNSRATLLTFDQLKQILSTYTPVTVSLNYGAIASSRRCQASYTGNHTVLVVGYDASRSVWFVHDPLCKSGAYRELPSAEFRNAVETYYAKGVVVGTVALR